MIVEISFDTIINSSLQVGDMLYYTAAPVDGIASGKPLPMGAVTNVLRSNKKVQYDAQFGTQPVPGGFILFSKPIEIEESSLKGYYADVTFTNRSTKRAELFAVSSDIALSSK